MPWAPVAWAWRGSASSMARTRSVMPSIAAAQISIGAPAAAPSTSVQQAPQSREGARQDAGDVLLGDADALRGLHLREPAEEQVVDHPPLQPVETLDRLIEHDLILDRQVERDVCPMADAAVVERKLLLVLARIQ